MADLAKLAGKLGSALLGVEDFHATLQESTEEIAAATGATFVALHLEQAGSRYEFRFDRAGRVPASFALHHPVRGPESAGRRSWIVTADSSAGENAGLTDAGLRYVVIAPVPISKEESLGMCVGFGEPGRALSGADIDSIETLATILALGASRHAFQQLSVYDPWTHLYNRRWLDATLPGEVERSRRYRQPLALLSLDVDRFKNVNDGHGHPAGDKVLAEVARVLTESIRSCDFAVRIGGDEFLVVFPATGAKGATKIARRILDRVRALSFGDARNPMKVTISGGVAIANPHSTVDTLMADADRALYRAKNEGRDTIHVPEETPLFDDASADARRGRRRRVSI